MCRHILCFEYLPQSYEIIHNFTCINSNNLLHHTEKVTFTTAFCHSPFYRLAHTRPQHAVGVGKNECALATPRVRTHRPESAQSQARECALIFAYTHRCLHWWIKSTCTIRQNSLSQRRIIGLQTHFFRMIQQIITVYAREIMNYFVSLPTHTPTKTKSKTILTNKRFIYVVI